MGFVPCGIIITPGVPLPGGVMIGIGKMLSGVGVKVGAGGLVGTGGGVGLANKSSAEQPKLNMSKAPNARNSEMRRPYGLRLAAGCHFGFESPILTCF